MPWRRSIMENEIRIGFGNDDHRIWPAGSSTGNSKKAKPIVLGGKLVSRDYGVDANSDGDVVYHAIINAIFLAAGKADIGSHFPDADPSWSDRSSGEMLKIAMDEVGKDGWSVNNVAVMITAGEPKLKGHINDIKANIAAALGIEQNAVGIGATTGENLSQVSRKEGIHADAVVTLKRP